MVVVKKGLFPPPLNQRPIKQLFRSLSQPIYKNITLINVNLK